MINQKLLRYFFLQKRVWNFLFKKEFKIIILYLVCFIGVLPVYSLAQPLANGKDKFLGCSVGKIQTTFIKYWNQVTPENAGKWGSVEGSKDAYNWSPLDNIYNYSLANGFPYKHHAFVWGSQYPTWITSLDSASQRAEVEEWIRLAAERYPEMNFADVVNEPFNAPPPFKNALGGNGATGWDWVITAFQWARQYCLPEVKLLLNEYNVIHSNTATSNYIALIDTLKIRGLIDGIGIQGHYFEFKSPEGGMPSYSYPVNTIKANLDRLAATGLPIYISEFDINEEKDTIQLQNYKIYFPLFWEHPAVRGITLWGYVQYDIWKPNAYLITDRNAERPALKWLRTYLASPMRPLLVSPNGTTGEPRNPVLVWHSSDSAATYNLQVSVSSVFASVILDTIVTDTLFQMDPLDANSKFYWRVSAANQHGTSEYSTTASFTTGDQITSVEDVNRLPAEYELFQNYPNPFNPATTISFRLPLESYVRLVLVDVLGKVVKEIAAENFHSGIHHVKMDASGLPSGIYFYKIKAGNFESVKKLILMK